MLKYKWLFCYNNRNKKKIPELPSDVYSAFVFLRLAAVMARFSCSYVTNITTFQEPRRRKEGMNLERETKTLKGL